MKFAYSVLVVVLLLSIANAMTYMGELDDKSQVIVDDTYTAHIRTSNNNMRINNMFGLQMFPTIFVGGEIIVPSSPVAPILTPGQSVNEYTITYPENFANQVYASATVTLEPGYIQHSIKVENTNENEEKLVEIDVVISAKGTTYIYAPYKRNVNAKYLLISPTYNMEKGEALLVDFDNLPPSYEQQLEINVKPALAKTLAWKVNLAAKSSQTISFKYSTGYVTDDVLLQQSQFTPSQSSQYLLNVGGDPVFELQNVEALVDFKVPSIEGASASDVLESISDSIDNLPDTVTVLDELPKNIDFSDLSARKGTGLTSLEKAIIYRELARDSGLPAQLEMGLKGNEYHAWSTAFVGNKEVVYDPGGKKGEFQRVYSEPFLESCKGDDLTACPWSAGIQTDLLCVGDFCVSGFILIALAALVFISLFAVFQYKTEVIYQLLGMKKESESGMLSSTLAGTYNVVETKYIPKDPLEEAVFAELKRRAGAFNEVEYARVTGFSEPLVQSTLEYFIDKGIIKKRY